MIEFSTIIKKFNNQGEKTGWTYIEIPVSIAETLRPGVKKSFRVKGFLDACPVEQMALMPMGGGDFIMALRADIRKKIHKRMGEKLKVKLEADVSPQKYNNMLMDCLEDDEAARIFFNKLTPGHRRYFSVWIDQAKTEATKIDRVAKTLNALASGWDFGKMLKALKK